MATSFGFIVGFLIPVPFLDIPILYSVNSIMILKIASCYNIQKEEIYKSTYAKLIFGIECNVESSIRTIGNGASMVIGKDIGKDFVHDLGENQLKDWTKSGLNALKSGVNVNIAKEAEKLTVKDGKTFFQYLYQLIPSFKSGINKGVEEGSEQLGKKLGEVIIENSSKNLETTVVKNVGENAGKIFSKTITANLNNFFNATKIIPLIGPIIGGVLDSHSAYTTRKNAMNFFNNYLAITNGGEYVLKKKKIMKKYLKQWI